MERSPVALFVYNRPGHTEKVLHALKENLLADETDLYIFSDAPKKTADISAVDRVRQVIRCVSGFKKITLIERAENFGLAKSIVDGVSLVVARHGRIIVLEDDIITSRCFLSYMNLCLDFYRDKKKIWHVSGWGYPLEFSSEKDVFVWRVMNCWGWATWDDRWDNFSKCPEALIESFSPKDIKRFNLDGVYPFWKQVLLNKNMRLNTWAVFWYATIFSRGGLCVSPFRSYVNNIGNDGSGVNCSSYDVFLSEGLSDACNPKLECELVENLTVVSDIKKLYASKMPGLLERLLRRALITSGRLINFRN